MFFLFPHFRMTLQNFDVQCTPQCCRDTEKIKNKIKKNIGQSAGKIVRGRLQLNTHAPNLCGFDGVRL